MQLLHVYTDDKPPRFYIDGKRVSRDRYETEIIKANMLGKAHDTFYTVCKQIGNGKFKRKNYSHIH